MIITIDLHTYIHTYFESMIVHEGIILITIDLPTYLESIIDENHDGLWLGVGM